LHAPEFTDLFPTFSEWNVQMRIYVGNLSFNTDEQQIEQLFTAIGPVESVRLIRDQATGRSRGFGFVEMADAGHGQTACQTLDQREFEGRRLTVNEAKPQERRGGGGFDGGGAGRQRREARW
jgi:RNA recognition motif-containing protein